MRKSQLPYGWYTIPFEDSIVKVKYRNSKIQSKEYLKKGKYPIIDQGESFIAGYTNLEEDLYDGELPVIIFGDHTKRFKYIDFKFAIGADGTQILQPNKEILVPKFLFYYLRSLKLPDARYSRHYKFLRETKVVLPPLDQQEKIASILEKAEKLIQKRKEIIELIDKYLQSVFSEMFGDPVTNTMGWGLKTLASVCSVIHRYPNFHGFTYVNGGTHIVRIRNILKSGIIDPELKNYVSIDPFISRDYPLTILELNDIVMAVRGDGSTAKRIGYVNSKNLVGANISPNLLRFKADCEIINPRYMFYLLTSQGGQKILDKYVNRTTKKNITAGDIKGIEMPIPPIELQDKFAQIVEKIERLKQKQIESTQELDTLFNSLMQKAFIGELTDDEYMPEFGVYALEKLIKSEFVNKEIYYEELIMAINKQYENIEYEKIKTALFECLEKQDNNPFLVQKFDSEIGKVFYKIN